MQIVYILFVEMPLKYPLRLTFERIIALRKIEIAQSFFKLWGFQSPGLAPRDFFPGVYEVKRICYLDNKCPETAANNYKLMCLYQLRSFHQYGASHFSQIPSLLSESRWKFSALFIIVLMAVKYSVGLYLSMYLLSHNSTNTKGSPSGHISSY